MILGAGGGLWYVQHLKSENEILTLNNAKLNDAVDQQQAVIEQQLKDIEQFLFLLGYLFINLHV